MHIYDTVFGMYMHVAHSICPKLLHQDVLHVDDVIDTALQLRTGAHVVDSHETGLGRPISLPSPRVVSVPRVAEHCRFPCQQKWLRDVKRKDRQISSKHFNSALVTALSPTSSVCLFRCRGTGIEG